MKSRDIATANLIQRSLKEIKQAMDSKLSKDALRKTDELLSRFPRSIEANVSSSSSLDYVQVPQSIEANVCKFLSRLRPMYVRGAYFLIKLQSESSYQDKAIDACIRAKDLVISEKKNPTIDKKCLQTLEYVCESLKQWDIINRVLECVSESNSPLSTDGQVLEQTFYSHVHQYRLLKQHQISMRLHSKFSEDQKYLFWVLSSIQLRIFKSKQPARLILDALEVYRKFLRDTNAMVSGLKQEVLLLVISFLEQSQKYDEAIELFSELKNEDMLSDTFALSMEGRILAASKRFSEAAKVFQERLTVCPDDMVNFLQYLSCLLEDGSMFSRCINNDQIHTPKFGDRKKSDLSDAQFNSCMESASAFVRSLMLANSDGIIRCPSLALVEIESRKFLQGMSDSETLLKAVLEYLHSFGHMATCMWDVESYLQLLTADDIQTLVQGFKPDLVSGDDVTRLAKQVNCFKLQELIELSLSELKDNSVTMTMLFTMHLQESMHGVDLPSLECNALVQDLPSLTCNALVQLFWRTQDVDYLLEAILMLEFGLSVRICAQYKILLVHLYSHLGAFRLAYDRYKSLKIKNTHLSESISHNIVPYILSSPFLDYSVDLIEDYTRLVERHLVTSADNAKFAYQVFNYSAVFGDFLIRDRFLRSHNSVLTRIETPILQLKLMSDKLLEAEQFLQGLGSQLEQLSSEGSASVLVVNDDMQTRPWWSPTPSKNYLLEPFQKILISHHLEDKNQLRFLEQSGQMLVIKRKSLLPQLILHCIKSASLFIDSSTDSAFTTLLVKYAMTYGIALNDAENIVYGRMNFQEVYSSEDLLCFTKFVNEHELVHEYDLPCSYWSDMDVLFRDVTFNVFLSAHKLVRHEAELPSTYWRELDKLFWNFTEKGNAPGHRLPKAPGVLLSSFVQLVTEPLAWHSLVLQSCVRSLVPLKKLKTKKGLQQQMTPAKRKKRVRAQQLNAAALSSIVSSCEIFEFLMGSFAPFSSFDTHCSGKVGSILCGLKWDAGAVENIVAESLDDTLTEFFKLCRRKLVMLKGLKDELESLIFL